MYNIHTYIYVYVHNAVWTWMVLLYYEMVSAFASFTKLIQPNYFIIIKFVAAQFKNHHALRCSFLLKYIASNTCTYNSCIVLPAWIIQ